MNGNKMAKFLLLLIAVDLLLFASTEGKPWWGRRRSSRRRCSSSRPGGVAWVNQWQQPFSSYCSSSKPVAVHINWERERENHWMMILSWRCFPVKIQLTRFPCMWYTYPEAFAATFKLDSCVYTVFIDLWIGIVFFSFLIFFLSKDRFVCPLKRPYDSLKLGQSKIDGIE